MTQRLGNEYAFALRLNIVHFFNDTHLAHPIQTPDPIEILSWRTRRALRITIILGPRYDALVRGRLLVRWLTVNWQQLHRVDGVDRMESTVRWGETVLLHCNDNRMEGMEGYLPPRHYPQIFSYGPNLVI